MKRKLSSMLILVLVFAVVLINSVLTVFVSASSTSPSTSSIVDGGVYMIKNVNRQQYITAKLEPYSSQWGSGLARTIKYEDLLTNTASIATQSWRAEEQSNGSFIFVAVSENELDGWYMERGSGYLTIDDDHTYYPTWNVVQYPGATNAVYYIQDYSYGDYVMGTNDIDIDIDGYNLADLDDYNIPESMLQFEFIEVN